MNQDHGPSAAHEILLGTGQDVRMSVSLLVPVFNEQQSVAKLVDRLQRVMGETDIDYEIIVINDGSSDDTPEILRWVEGIRVVHHTKNLGYGAALKTGIRHARHPLIAIVDADGTYPVERLPEMIELMDESDMVVGARTGDNVEYPLLRSVPKWILVQFAQWLSRTRIPDLNSGMRVFRKQVAEQFVRTFPDGFSFTTTITLALLTNRYRVHFVPIDYFAREGHSKIHPVWDTLRILHLILRSSMYFAPLRVFLPVATVFFAGFLGSFIADLVEGNLNERTLLLLVASVQLGMFSLLADMIANRTN